MSRQTTSLLLVVALSAQLCLAQKADSIQIAKWVIPTGLMVGGALISDARSDIAWQHDINKNLHLELAPIDDYIQYLPSAIIATQMIIDQDMASRHGWPYIISTASTAAITHGMKRLINKRRPNGGHHAFPSGHTSFAFSTSTVLYHMTREQSPTLAYLSYLPAITVAGYRVMRDKHWISDVLFGAGLGILATHLTYHWMPTRQNHPDASSAYWRIGPTNHGIGIAYRW